jgi:hypothetical protein
VPKNSNDRHPIDIIKLYVKEEYLRRQYKKEKLLKSLIEIDMVSKKLKKGESLSKELEDDSSEVIISSSFIKKDK